MSFFNEMQKVRKESRKDENSPVRSNKIYTFTENVLNSVHTMIAQNPSFQNLLNHCYLDLIVAFVLCCDFRCLDTRQRICGSGDAIIHISHRTKKS